MFSRCLAVLSKRIRGDKRDKKEHLIMWLNSNKDLSTCLPKLRYSKKHHKKDAKGQAKTELQVLWRVHK